MGKIAALRNTTLRLDLLRIACYSLCDEYLQEMAADRSYPALRTVAESDLASKLAL
jgi:hypothetical protein